MFNKELFFSLCEKYDVELSDRYGKVMLKVGDNVREFTDEGVKNIIPKYQTYFLYDSLKPQNRQAIMAVYVPDELLTAC